MIRTIAHKEMRELAREGRFRERRAEIGRALQEERDRLARDRAEALRITTAGTPAGEVSPFATGPDHPYYLGTRQGTNAFLPPGPLASLAAGQTDLYPFGYLVTTGNRESLVTSEPLENPVKLHTGTFDLAFVLIYLGPLLILALSFNLISEEKEGGTLGLLLSQPVREAGLYGGGLRPRPSLCVRRRTRRRHGAENLPAPGSPDGPAAPPGFSRAAGVLEVPAGGVGAGR